MAMTEIQKREEKLPRTVEETPRPVVSPPVDIFENENEFILVADLPGVSRDTLSLRLEDQELAIEGRWSLEEKGGCLAATFRPMDYARTFSVPAGIDPERIAAEMRGGVLTVHLPKAEQYRPRQIQVTTE